MQRNDEARHDDVGGKNCPRERRVRYLMSDRGRQAERRITRLTLLTVALTWLSAMVDGAVGQAVVWGNWLAIGAAFAAGGAKWLAIWRL